MPEEILSDSQRGMLVNVGKRLDDVQAGVTSVDQVFDEISRLNKTSDYHGRRLPWTAIEPLIKRAIGLALEKKEYATLVARRNDLGYLLRGEMYQRIPSEDRSKVRDILLETTTRGGSGLEVLPVVEYAANANDLQALDLITQKALDERQYYKGEGGRPKYQNESLHYIATEGYLKIGEFDKAYELAKKIPAGFVRASAFYNIADKIVSSPETREKYSTMLTDIEHELQTNFGAFTMPKPSN